MTKVVIIDGYAILHRAYHALPPMRNKRGEMTNAVYGFVSMLLKIIQEIKPNNLVITFDRPEKTLRRQKFEDYQGKRADVDEGLSVQFGFARDMAKSLGIPSYELAGYESDDLIGTICTRLKNDSSVSDVVVVTGDRDLFQLVNEKVKIYMPGRGLSEAKIYTPSEVIERMGVKPSQIVDYKALVGDSSDNYPGVPGVGPKTAINLLSKYENLENIYKNLDSIPEKIKAKLVQNKELAKLSQDLAKIYTDVVFDFNIDDSSSWDLDSPKAIAFFNEMGFNTLTKRVIKVGEDLEKEKQTTLF